MASTLLNEQMVTQDVRPSRDKWFRDNADAVRVWTDWQKAHRDDYLSGVTYPLLADPKANRWTALQNWNPDTGKGALLAFRQDDDADTTTIALKNVPDGTYELRTAPDDALARTVSGQELRDGLSVTLGARRESVVYTITRVG